MNTDHVVVIGAGPAGLTAAELLTRRGRAVTVVEADSVVGGISRTVRYKEFRFDIGGHRFFTKIGPVQALWDEWLGEEMLTVPRLSRIFYDGRFFDYPLKAGNALRGLGPFRAAAMVLSYAWARLFPTHPETDFETWVSNRFGRRLYETFFRTYTEKVWGMKCTEIQADWAAQRIQNLSLASAIRSALPLQRRSGAVRSLIDEFRYPRLGPGQMWEVVADRVKRQGGTLLFDTRATGIDVEDGRIRAVRVRREGGAERVVPADHVVSSMPLAHLVAAFGEAAPPAVAAAARALRYRDFLVVALIVDRADIFPDNWVYVHSPGVQVGRIQNFGNWSRAMAPRPGHSCVGMEYFCFENDALWDTPDEDLIRLAADELETLGLAGGGRVVDGSVVRVPKAYPVYDPGYADRLRAIRAFADTLPNLHPVGRNGLHKYNNQDHSMLTAMLAVENIAGAAHDIWAVNSDLEYHETMRLDRATPDTEDVQLQTA